jgi:aspartate/methionine/tyrosine aminotransferase
MLMMDVLAADGINVRALVVINPGNPTGQVMSTTLCCSTQKTQKKKKS